MIKAILSTHNKYRATVGLPPLRWSNALAKSAQQWAYQLAQIGRLQHSRSGENLWSGASGRYHLEQMVDSWANEKQYFIPYKPFPYVSKTGNYRDVGHYTQVVWRNTTEVGCGLASGHGKDFLVCHYNPPGNVMRQKVF